MRKRMVLLAAILALSLVGCGSRPSGEENRPQDSLPPVLEVSPTPEPVPTAPPPAETPISTPVPTEKPKPVPAPSPTPVETSVSLPEEDRPTDAEVLDAYQAAKEAYAWFEENSNSGLMVDELDCITLEASAGGGEWGYCRVTRPGLESLDGLRAYLKTLFSDEVVDELLEPSRALFADGPEGGLYVRDYGSDMDAAEDPVALEVLWQEEGPPTCVIQTVAEEEDPAVEEGVTEKIYAYPYQKVGDKWVFTQFGPIM